jgi:hypothetical protein
MAVTISVRNSLIFTSTLLKNQRLSVNNLEPGLTMANLVLGIMLGPPMVWRFNRATLSFAISTAGGTDYVVSVPTLGQIETQWLVDPGSTPAGAIHEFKGAVALPKVSAKRRPQRIAPQYDTNTGNITFRVDAIPDRTYNAFIDFQQKAPLIQSFGQTFSPVPDEFGYLFNRGMLSEGALLVNDSRFAIWRREFLAGLLATQDGLDAQAKSIFFDQMMNIGRTATRSQGMAQSGNQGRQQD